MEQQQTQIRHAAIACRHTGPVLFAAFLNPVAVLEEHNTGAYCKDTVQLKLHCLSFIILLPAGKLMDGGAVDGRMQATLAYPKGSSSSSSSALGAAAVGKLEADLRHKGLWPRTRFVATGTL